jgi:hypothetical protein
MAFISQDGNSTPLPDPIPFTVTAMFEAYAATRRDEERAYLGASVVGEECERKLWYSFRWTHALEVIDGRKAYLFDTGHVEEARLVAALKATPGVQVTDRGPDGDQLGFTTLGGHFRGHLDGEVIGVLEAPTVPHVLEVKTHNEKSFKDVLKQGVKAAKPQHYGQMQVYMLARGLTRALYLFENKNTSDVAAERVEYNPMSASAQFAKAERVIQSPRPLAKLHDDPTSKAAFACGWCPARGVCHEGAWARINCRTCLHSTPVEDGWWCDRHNAPLDLATQRVGCPQHLFIPDLVPGEQVDADEATETVTYLLRSGETWVDGRVE